MPKKFPPEFKRDVANVARRGDLSIAEVAADFDVSPESVRRWMRQADIDDGVKDGLATAPLTTPKRPARSGERLGGPRRQCARLGLLVLLVGLVASCGTSATSTVQVINPTSQTKAAIVAAFNRWENPDLDPACSGEIINGSLHVATIRSTQLSWAVANFQPPGTCDQPKLTAPWDQEPQPVIAIFTHSPQQLWTMSGEPGGLGRGRYAFPCTVGPGGTPPKPGNVAIPRGVLEAWHMTPKPTAECSNVAARTPRG